MDEPIKQAITEAVQDAFSSGIEKGRFVDISRVPLICQSIVQIGKDITELKEVQAKLVTQDQFWPVRTLVYSTVALMLLGVVVSLILLVLPHTQLP